MSGNLTQFGFSYLPCPSPMKFENASKRMHHDVQSAQSWRLVPLTPRTHLYI
jgi:hypothetical protein